MKQEFSAKEVQIIIGNSWNYEAIRIYAVNIFNRANQGPEISEKCMVVYNPARLISFDTTTKIGIEKYLDCKILNEEVIIDHALKYMQCFAVAFQVLFNANKLVK